MKKVKSISIDLNGKDSENSISEKLSKVRNKTPKVELEVLGLSEVTKIKFNLDIGLFSKIKEIQDIPDWVIVKLMLAAGKLKTSDYGERIASG